MLTRRIAKKKGKDASKPKARPPPPAAPSISAYRPVVSAEQEDDFMSSILGTMDTLPASTSTFTRKRKPSPEYDYSSSSSPVHYGGSTLRRKASYGDTSSDGLIDDDATGVPSSDDLYMSPKKRVKVADNGAMTPAAERLAQLDVDDYDSAFDDVDMDAFMDVDEEVNGKPPVKSEPKDVKINKIPVPAFSSVAKKEEAAPSWLSVYDSLSVAEPDTLGPLASSSSTTSAASNVSALEPDGSLRFFWLDYLELDGKLYFIGKLKDKVTGAWVSCCVTVEGIQRNLFVLPREKRVETDEDGEMFDTDIVPSPQDVHSDFEMIRKQIGVKSWRGKFVKRKYAFGEKDVPRGESQWMKVVYGFNGMFIGPRNKRLSSALIHRPSNSAQCM